MKTIIKQNVTIIGIGNMGRAFAEALISANIIDSTNLFLSSRKRESLKKFQKNHSIKTTTNNKRAVENTDIVILAVKPADVETVSQEISSVLKPSVLLISIAAGIRINTIQRWLNQQCAIVRAMPNTPAQIGQGVTGWAVSSRVTPRQKKIAKLLLSALGSEIFVSNESFLDVITAISGSGPAYFYYFTESLIKAGADLGLSSKQAKQLAIKTFLGSAKLLEITQKTPVVLRQAVTSKGGTTESALTCFKENKLEELVLRAVQAAYKRSKELSKVI